MSLVICSNVTQDKAEARQSQSINDAYAFRNELSSTMTIPENAQVAVQSVKVNVDGRFAIGKHNSNFYHYFGEKLDLDGETAPQMENVTSNPVLVRLLDTAGPDKVLEMNKIDFSNVLQERIRANTFHPNQKGKPEVELETNASEGYKITFSSNNTSTNNRPSTMENFGTVGATEFSFGGNVFTRVNTDNQKTCGIAPQFPLSTSGGRLVVNLSGGSANANASGVPWVVGLSRMVNESTAEEIFAPDYFSDSADEFGVFDLSFCDFAVCRNDADELVLLHSVWDDDEDVTVLREVDYWNNGSTDFASGGRFNLASGTDAAQYSKVQFTITGEQVKAELYHNGSSQYRTITEYRPAEAATTYFKPVNQACWCLHPVLGVGTDGTNDTCSAEIEHYNGLEIEGYNATNGKNGGWFESCEAFGGIARCMELEQRSWNTYQDLATDTYVQKGFNASDSVDYNHVLILTQSSIYTGTEGANAKLTLGYNHSVVEANTVVGDKETFLSDITPETTSSQAIFVRLNNFGQRVTNARMGNRSNIISMLPRFDNSQEIGRLHFEPNNLVYIDLDNPGPLQVNEFDISFSYLNEQYAQILTGQSVVVLHFRKKPRDLL